MSLQVILAARALQTNVTLILEPIVHVHMDLIVAEPAVLLIAHVTLVRDSLMDRQMAFQILQQAEPLVAPIACVEDLVPAVFKKVMPQHVGAGTERVRAQVTLKFYPVPLQVMREQRRLFLVEEGVTDFPPVLGRDVRDEVISHEGLLEFLPAQTAYDPAFVESNVLLVRYPIDEVFRATITFV